MRGAYARRYLDINGWSLTTRRGGDVHRQIKGFHEYGISKLAPWNDAHQKIQLNHKSIKTSEQESAVYLTDLKLSIYGAQR